MKRWINIVLTFIFVFLCSYTAAANVNINTTVKILDKNGTRDISAKLNDRYITDDYVLMVPAKEVLEEMGFSVVNWDSSQGILTAATTKGKRRIAMYIKGTSAGLYAYQCEGLEKPYLIDRTIEKPAVVNGKPMIAIKDLVSLTFETVRVDTSTSTFYIAMDGYETDYIYSLPTSDVWENKAKSGIIGKESTAKENLVALYSADGRIRYTKPSEVEAYKKVGWYEKCPLIGKEIWVSKLNLPYDGFEPDSAYMKTRPVWLQRGISGYIPSTVEKINENQSRIQEFYFWENNKVVRISYNELFTGYDVMDQLVVCQSNPKTTYGISNWEWNRIQNDEYTFIGMSKNGFKLAGHSKPDRVNTTNTGRETHEQWVYQWVRTTDYYYFDNGRLTAWQD